jgi:NhaP-type Na+/H+ or K+/H+ antiporter
LAFDFIKIAGVGALIGIGIGLAVSQIIRHVDDPEVPRDSIILRDPS